MADVSSKYNNPYPYETVGALVHKLSAFNNDMPVFGFFRDFYGRACVASFGEELKLDTTYFGDPVTGSYIPHRCVGIPLKVTPLPNHLQPPGVTEIPKSEEKDDGGDDPVYYLNSILRTMREIRTEMNKKTKGHLGLGDEVLNDNIDWLDCYIEKLRRQRQPK